MTTLAQARRALAAHMPAHEARLLMEGVTGLDAAAQAAAPERLLSAAERARLDDLVRRRAAGEPLQHLLGWADFWTLRLKSDGRALVPRGDTETLVRAALEHLGPEREARILDLGAGSGAILLALLSELPRARGLGVDASAEALSLARENAALTGLAERAEFLQGSWDSAAMFDAMEPFDLVVSNPPYIRSAEIAALAPEVRRDPLPALDGGADGLDAYRAILALLPRLLRPGGRAALEIGWDQAAEVTALAAAVPGLAAEGMRPDLEGRPRALVFRARP